MNVIYGCANGNVNVIYGCFQGMNCAGGVQPTLEFVCLRNMRKKPVAFGRRDLTVPPPDNEYYLIMIDEIVLPNEGLCDDERTFEDVYVGESIVWPQTHVTTFSV